MNAKTIISIEKPATQTVPAVCALLAWKGRSSNPLPQFVEMGSGEGRVVLVLSNKRDAYYCVTAAACSCPAAYYNHGKPCKHMRRYFPEQATAKPATIKQPNHGAWHGHNGPIIEDGERPFAKASSSFEMVDTTPDASPREVAYQEMKFDREMWPCEA